MGDGIGGPVMGILTNNAFQLLVSHVRKDNKEEYGKTEKIIIAKIDNPDDLITTKQMLKTITPQNNNNNRRGGSNNNRKKKQQHKRRR